VKQREFLWGPVDQACLPDDLVNCYWAHGAGVSGVGAIVTQDEDVQRGYKLWTVVGAACLSLPGFVQHFAVDEDLAIPDLYGLSWERDDSLDQWDFLTGYLNDNNVTPARAMEKATGDFVDQDPLVVVEVRLHAWALHDHCLCDEDIDEQCNKNRRHYRAQELQNGSL